MTQQDNDTQFIQFIGKQFIRGYISLVSQIADAIARHYLLPAIEAIYKRNEKVWAGQVVLTNEKLIAIRTNKEVTGKVFIEDKHELPISPDLAYLSDRIDDFEPIKSEREYVHVVVICRAEDPWKGRILHYKVEAIRPPLPKNQPDLSMTMKRCPSCRKMFELKKRRPTQRYCSTKCREKEKKRKYREKKSQKSRATGELSTVSIADMVDNIRQI